MQVTFIFTYITILFKNSQNVQLTFFRIFHYTYHTRKIFKIPKKEIIQNVFEISPLNTKTTQSNFI